jgi:hypothetical protein
MALTRAQAAVIQESPVESTPYAYGSNTTAGNVLVVVVTATGTGTCFTGITDSASNTWQSIALYSQTPNGGGQCQTKIWYTLSCTGGACSVTGTGSTNTVGMMALFEYGGFASASLGVSAGTTSPVGTTLTPASSTFSLSGKNSVVIGTYVEGSSGYSGSATAGTNYTIQGQNGGKVYVIEDQINTTTETVAGCTLPNTANNTWTYYVVSFGDSGGGGTTGLMWL